MLIEAMVPQGIPSVLSKQSAYHVGPSEPALLQETIGARFSSTVQRFPERLALKTNDEQLTWRELDIASDAFALALRGKLGVDVGDRVAVSLGTIIPHFVILYALFKLGAIYVPLNPGYSPEQAVAAIEHITACCYITSSHVTLPYKQPKSTRPVIDQIIKETAIPRSRVVVFDNCAEQDLVETSGDVIDYGSLVASYYGCKLPVQADLDPQDTVNLLFTSGTTSAPKAVCLSHWNILNNAYISGRLWNVTEEDILAATMPLYHTGGLVLVVLLAMPFGACITIPSQSFNALQTMRTLVRDRCTFFAGVPTMLQACVHLLDLPEFAGHDFTHIRTGLLGGSPIAPSLRRNLNEKMHLHDLSNVYGMTELSPLITVALPSHPADKRYGTVGRTFPHCRVRIAARDDPYRTLDIGEKGEVLGTGMVMKGYWQDPVRTNAALVNITDADGITRTWMRTGDEGMMESDGFLTITGRIKDLIIRGGENIYPMDIADVLLQHADVENVAVVGLPDEYYGEVVAAFVVPKTSTYISSDGDEADPYTLDLRAGGKAKLVRFDSGVSLEGLTGEGLRSAVRAKLSRHLVPKVVFWVDQMPMTPSGKVENYKLVALGSKAVAAALSDANGAVVSR